ncbi:hypothetical protein DYB32_000157 [Aphanomyces invadans]|uniref:H/ACA ribonucleoprotein complex non-core subunit NAF1 n=1 Tax=Aphanomyces invadans TaxID=157072 RepID=A0A418BAS2_9STRA|nr:hypothetical protein DYB32_000157 [Aphanomyces invadans]
MAQQTGSDPSRQALALEKLAVLAKKLDFIEYPLAIPLTCTSFHVSEEVYVSASRGKANVTDATSSGAGRLFARGKVVDIAPPQYPGRVKIEYGDGSTYHANPARLMPRLCQAASRGNACKQVGVIVTATTDHYRRIARTQITSSDIVLEIGCDLGITVDLVADIVGPSKVIGVDKSHDSIQIAKETYPRCRFVEMDIFHSRDDLLVLAADCTKVLIDINGNRLLPAVVDALQLVVDGLHKVDLVVVKSVEMHRERHEAAEQVYAPPSDVVKPEIVEEGEVKAEELEQGVVKAEVVEHVDADMGASDESSDDDDESEPDSDDEDQSKLRLEIETALKKEEQGSLTSAPVVTAHEVSQLPVTKPAMEQLTAECPISKMGRILNVNSAERAITIQSVPNQLPLDEGSVLCLPDRVVLGCVDEVFGPVSLPMYLIRFDTADEIPAGATLHTDVYYATEHATYVQPEKCRVKGSDASNLYDEELGPDEMDFSDDEAEQSAKKCKRKRTL